MPADAPKSLHFVESCCKITTLIEVYVFGLHWGSHSVALFFVVIIYFLHEYTVVYKYHFLKTTKLILLSWRDSTKNHAFAGSKAPTYSPAGLKNPGHVGVARRRIKTLRAARRQHAIPLAGKTHLLLAWLDE